ncbi:MAG: preprotein translocase subunit YajC [Gammaproteobacteria bacterium]|nr:preprotein translocase subunit YajC [Gammaproteobacteria bacterium]
MQFLNDILSAFVNNAYAADAAQAPTGGGFSLVIMTGIFILFMYFVMWRPQSKRAKDHRMLINSLVKDDEVLTSGGILGKVAKVNDNYIVLTLGENIAITVQKSSIVSALPKGTLKSIA